MCRARTLVISTPPFRGCRISNVNASAINAAMDSRSEPGSPDLFAPYITRSLATASCWASVVTELGPVRSVDHIRRNSLVFSSASKLGSTTRATTARPTMTKNSMPRPTFKTIAEIPDFQFTISVSIDQDDEVKSPNAEKPDLLRGRAFRSVPGDQSYLAIAETMPEPTVRPPSRMVKRWPTSIAIGAISFTPSATLSPGMTISVPSGSSTVPVTSVVRK